MEGSLTQMDRNEEMNEQELSTIVAEVAHSQPEAGCRVGKPERRAAPRRKGGPSACGSALNAEAAGLPCSFCPALQHSNKHKTARPDAGAPIAFEEKRAR